MFDNKFHSQGLISSSVLLEKLFSSSKQSKKKTKTENKNVNSMAVGLNIVFNNGNCGQTRCPSILYLYIHIYY